MIDALDRLAAGPSLLLDGANGTELERRGAACELPLWSTRALLEDPALVRRVHADYAQAGADLLTANTFRTQRRVLAQAGLGGRAAELCALAVRLAREAAAGHGREIGVLGSAAPLEDCFRPELVPDAVCLEQEHGEHARNLARAGVDAILVETMNTTREAAAAVAAASATGLPVLASFVCGADARLLSGEPLADALAALAQHRPAALLVNCLPPSRVAPCLAPLRASGLPFGVYANLGEPLDAGRIRHREDQSPAAFAELAAGWIEQGARLVGGCCGTTPLHLRAVAQRVRNA